MTNTAKLGRPRKNGDYDLYESPLYKLLLKKLPSEHVTMGRINTESLAEATKNARFTIYRWFETGRLSPKAIKTLVDVSKSAQKPKQRGALKQEDLIPFISGL